MALRVVSEMQEQWSCSRTRMCGFAHRFSLFRMLWIRLCSSASWAQWWCPTGRTRVGTCFCAVVLYVRRSCLEVSSSRPFSTPHRDHSTRIMPTSGLFVLSLWTTETDAPMMRWSSREIRQGQQRMSPGALCRNGNWVDKASFSRACSWHTSIRPLS